MRSSASARSPPLIWLLCEHADERELVMNEGDDLVRAAFDDAGGYDVRKDRAFARHVEALAEELAAPTENFPAALEPPDEARLMEHLVVIDTMRVTNLNNGRRIAGYAATPASAVRTLEGVTVVWKHYAFDVPTPRALGPPPADTEEEI